MKIKLFKIRTIAAILTPLYISICAAILLDLKRNMKWDFDSILYFLGLISFIIACYISNELFRRSSNYDNIYDIQINEYVKDPTKEKPKRENIYDTCEKNIKSLKRHFQYFGIVFFGILGLIFVTLSCLSSDNQPHESDNPNIMLHRQVDSLKIMNHKQTIQTFKLQKAHD